MPTTLRNTDILFNDGSTQSTASFSVPGSLTAIGAVLLAANSSTSNILTGATVAGSGLTYVTAVQNFGAGSSIVIYSIGSNNVLLFPNTADGPLGTLVQSGPNNPGFQPFFNGATLPGTWRSLFITPARRYGFDGGYQQYTQYGTIGLFQRIS
jgi:hypothetical protein